MWEPRGKRVGLKDGFQNSKMLFKCAMENKKGTCEFGKVMVSREHWHTVVVFDGLSVRRGVGDQEDPVLELQPVPPGAVRAGAVEQHVTAAGGRAEQGVIERPGGPAG